MRHRLNLAKYLIFQEELNTYVSLQSFFLASSCFIGQSTLAHNVYDRQTTRLYVTRNIIVLGKQTEHKKQSKQFGKSMYTFN